jgi:hypothetical protein
MVSIRTMPIRTLLTIVGILATMLMVLLTAPDSALAKDTKPLPNNPTQKDLEGQGYTCGGMGSYGVQCTKKGSPDYYCNRDGTNCQKALITGTGKPTGGQPGSAPTHPGDAGVAHAPTQSPRPPLAHGGTANRPLAHGGTANRPLAHGTAPVAQR